MRRAHFVFVAVFSAACGPVVEGPQLEAPPDGLGYTNAIQAARLVLPDKPKIRQVAYFDPLAGEPPGDVVITEYRGPTTRAEAVAARDFAAGRYTSYEYGSVEDVTIDGRPAWAWFAIQHYEGVEYPDYIAVVSYPERTYSVEFSAQRADWKDRAYMRSVVESFAVKHGSDYDFPIVLTLVSVIACFSWVAWKSHHAPKRDRG